MAWADRRSVGNQTLVSPFFCCSLYFFPRVMEVSDVIRKFVPVMTLKQMTMKKFFLLILLSMLGSIVANAYDAEIDGIYYNFNGNEAEVTYQKNGNSDYSGVVVIPSSVIYNSRTYFVTSIGYNAFKKCRGLTSVNIPESVTKLGGDAFYGCIGLTSINIPESVTNIGSSAFYGCIGLTSITIPNSVTSIGSYAFENCSGLTSVNIGNSVTSIGGGAFEYCTSLTSITIPNGVSRIVGHTFKGCI